MGLAIIDLDVFFSHCNESLSMIVSTEILLFVKGRTLQVF